MDQTGEFTLHISRLQPEYLTFGIWWGEKSTPKTPTHMICWLTLLQLVWMHLPLKFLLTLQPKPHGARKTHKVLVLCKQLSHQLYGKNIGSTKDLLDALETTFGAVGGSSTYLQLVNMVKIQFTDSTDMLSQIQAFQDNYNRITLNGHSMLSKDLAILMFCLSLPDSYESTAWQYLDNITAIANY